MNQHGAFSSLGAGLPEIKGFADLARLHEGPQTCWYRAYSPGHGCPVLLKLPSPSRPLPVWLARFRREIGTLRELAGPGVGVGLELLEAAGRPVLVLEDSGDAPLAGGARPPLPEALTILLRVAETLARIHGRRWLVNTITPDTVFCNPADGAVRLMEFGAATPLAHPPPPLEPLAGDTDLTYAAPEQTGRVSWPVDFRSDLYALGATAYHLLTGRPPFTETEPLTLIHAHLARTPPAPGDLDSGLPAPVSAIVGKLLAKTPEARYQNAAGLAADLQQCLNQLHTQGRIDAAFTPGFGDTRQGLSISSQLYGRDTELRTLGGAFERIAGGGRELALVTGPSGIGKSHLVRELRKPVTGGGGRFLTGKFDQYSRGMPYAPLTLALRQWVRQTLGESDAGIRFWRERLLTALGANGQLLVDLLPELGFIIGPQPPLAESPPAETGNRFSRVLRHFLGALAQRSHPLVIVLEDLHWADPHGLRFLEQLLTTGELTHLLIVGTYRNDEVEAASPLNSLARRVRAAGTPALELAVGPLPEAEIRRLLADTLHLPPAAVGSLAGFCAARTGGNPFYLHRLLRVLHETRRLRPGPDGTGWTWDVEALGTETTGADVVEFMAGRLRRLPPETRDLLSLAACAGAGFDVALLAAVREIPVEQAVERLRDAMTAELILPAPEQPGEVCYRFVHDRVQQAAHSLLGAGEVRTVHLALGRHLLGGDRTPPAERLFAAADHLNQAVSLLTPEERHTLAQLNLSAGRRARQAAAHATALGYLQAGIDLLEPTAWTRQHRLAMDLHVEAAELACLSGDYPAMDNLLQAALDHADRLEQARALEVQIRALVTRDRLAPAVATGLRALRLLGLRIAEKPSPWLLLGGLLRTRWLLGGRSVADLSKLAPATDPLDRAAMRILMELAIACYRGSPQLMVLLALQMVNLTVRRGVTPESAFGFIGYALVLCSTGAIEAGIRYGRLATALAERAGDPQLENRVRWIFNGFVRCWKEPLAACREPLLEVGRRGVELGDFQYAGLGSVLYCDFGFCMGRPLERLDQETAATYRTLYSLNQDQALPASRALRQLVLNLRGASDDPLRLKGAACDEDHLRRQLEAADDRTNLAVLHLYRTFLYYLLGRHAEAARAAAQLAHYAEALRASAYLPVQICLEALALLALWRHRSWWQRCRIYLKVRANLWRLRRWANHAPANHRHRVQLVQAELAGVMGRAGRALEHYEQAIDAARGHGFLQDEALAWERAGRFHLSRGNRRTARAYLAEARHAYQRWGAQAKVEQLRREFGHAPAVDSDNLILPGGEQPSTLDRAAFAQAARAVSGELDLTRLVQTLVGIALETAGAQRGVLLLRQEQGLSVAAEGSSDRQPPVRVPDDLPLEEARQRLSIGLVHQTLHTATPLVLADAAADEAYLDDPYVAAARPRSVLCLPLLSRGQVTGVLYLENNLSAGVFTPERVQILQLLATQAVIAIDHARLYADLALSEKKYRTLFEDSRDAIFVSSGDGRMLDANRAMLELFGLDRDDLGQITVETFYARPEDHQRFRAQLERDGAVRNYELRLRRRDGSELDCLLTASISRDGAGRVVTCQGIVRDISEQKRAQRLLTEYSHTLEQQVEQRTRELAAATRKARDAQAAAELANRTKSAFLATVSHEIRTPLNAVIGMSGLLMDSSLDPRQREQVEIIRRSSEDLLAIINDILDFSKIEAGRLELERRPFHLGRCLDGALALLAVRARDKGLRLHCRRPQRLPEAVIGDPTRLRQILVNLLDNAVKFTETGEVVLEVASRDGRNLHFQVRDTGIGIPPQRMDHLFRAFSQLDASTARRYGGTGLGLAISQRLAELMGGRMWANSAGIPGLGSTFHLLLELEPTSAPPAEPADAPQPLPGTLPPLTILLAEDNPNNRKLTLMMLERLGYRADLAGDGREAAAAADRRAYDVILMDLQMPGMDGLEASRHIRRRCSGRPPRIIALTASALAEDRDACLAAGMDDYLSKPLRLDSLAAALARCRPHPAAPPAPQPPTAEPPDTEVLDPSALARLSALAEGNPGFVAEYAAGFLADAPAMLADMGGALHSGDGERLRRLAHSLKANAADLGLLRLRALCRKLETLARDGAMDRAGPCLEQVNRAYGDAAAALSTLCQPPAPSCPNNLPTS